MILYKSEFLHPLKASEILRGKSYEKLVWWILSHFFKIEVYLIYGVVLGSGVQ